MLTIQNKFKNELETLRHKIKTLKSDDKAHLEKQALKIYDNILLFNDERLYLFPTITQALSQLESSIKKVNNPTVKTINHLNNAPLNQKMVEPSSNSTGAQETQSSLNNGVRFFLSCSRSYAMANKTQADVLKSHAKMYG